MRKRILKIIGGLGFLLGALSGFAKFSKWVIGRLGDIDFLWTQYTAPTWTKDVVDFLEMTPPWLWPIVMFLAVAVLILERRWPRTSTEPHPAPPATQQATKRNPAAVAEAMSRNLQEILQQLSADLATELATLPVP